MIMISDIVILKKDFILTSLVEPIIVGRKNQKCEIVSIDKDIRFSKNC